MEWLDTLLSHSWTAPMVVLVECIFVLLFFAKGWLLIPMQIKTLTEVQNLRISELQEALKLGQEALKLEQARNDLLMQQLSELAVVGEAVDRILNSLPTKNGEGP